MFTIVDYLDIAAAEQHRTELRRIASRTKRVSDRTPGDDSQPGLCHGERRRLLVSLIDAWAEAPSKEVESADPLGVWSWGYAPRRSFRWPERRALLDWSAWLVLMVVAGYLAAVI